MEKFLLAAAVLFVLSILWLMLEFGKKRHPTIANDKIINGGIVMLMGSCTVCWSIWIAYTIGYSCYRMYELISYLM